MNNNIISPKDFITQIFVASFLSKKYIPFADFSGFIKNDTEIALFNYQDLELYIDNYNEIKIFALTEDEYKDFKIRNIKHNRIKIKTTVLPFDEAFFYLSGKTYEKIRRYRNYYTKKIHLTIKDEPNSFDDITIFVRKWKQIRQNAHFQFFIGYEINFFQKYYTKFKNQLICRFFYIGNELVGYVVLERINKNLYNLIHRKANTNYQNLCLYIDYYAFQTVFNEIQEPFYINMGSDIGESGMSNYKAKTFKVEPIIYYLYDVKIKKDMK